MKYTYKQAFDLVTEAYIKGKIQPFNASFCFCGTLAGGTSDWYRSTALRMHNAFNGYAGNDFVRMEFALLNTISDVTHQSYGSGDAMCHPKYETALFLGMTAALEVLRQIHEERGEVIDETPKIEHTLQNGKTANQHT